MVREIIKPQSEEYTIHIPKEYIDTQVEILVLPLEDMTKTYLTQEQQQELTQRIDTFHKDRTIGRTWDEIKLELSR